MVLEVLPQLPRHSPHPGTGTGTGAQPARQGICRTAEVSVSSSTADWPKEERAPSHWRIQFGGPAVSFFFLISKNEIN